MCVLRLSLALILLCSGAPAGFAQGNRGSNSPSDFQAYLQLGEHVLGEAGIWQCREEFQTAVRLQPGNSEAHRLLGHALMEWGDVGEGKRKKMEKAIALAPATPEDDFYLGVFFARQEHVSNTLREFQAAAKLNPKLAEAHFNVGMAYLQQGNAQQAIQCLRRAVALQPSYAQAQRRLGQALAERGNMQKRLPPCRGRWSFGPTTTKAFWCCPTHSGD